MNQKTSTESVRFAPIALAIVLLAILGLLALRVNAEGLQVESEEAQQMMQAKEEQQRALLKEMQQERLQEFEDAQKERMQVREEMLGSTEEKMSEFAEKRAETLNAYRSLLDKKKSVLEERVQEHKKEREMKKDEYKTRLSLSAQVHIGQYVERIVLRMDTAVLRLEQIAKRIETRIEKIEEKGIDLSNAKVELSNTHVLIGDAHEYIELIGDVSTETLVSENPGEQVREIHDAVLLAKDCIVSIHRALTEVVKLVKSSVVENGADSSSEMGDDYTSVYITDPYAENIPSFYSDLEVVHEYVAGEHVFTLSLVTPTQCNVIATGRQIKESHPEQVNVYVEIDRVLEEKKAECPLLETKQEFTVIAPASEDAEITLTVNGVEVDWEE